jgi:methylated-DNA-[protein]-cysteine S-methyltransferase
MPTPFGTLQLYASAGGLRAVTLPNEPREIAEDRMRHRDARERQDLRIVDDESTLRETLAQLAEYFAGDRRDFDLLLDPRGTPFQISVWGELARIPFGETRTYADIARAIGRPTATRAVGAANGTNPIPIILPCHRVIGSDGTLTGYGGGLQLKARLLAWEQGEQRVDETPHTAGVHLGIQFPLPLGEGQGEGVPGPSRP